MKKNVSVVFSRTLKTDLNKQKRQDSINSYQWNNKYDRNK